MGRYYRLKKLVEANMEAGTTLIFFTAEDVNFSKRQIAGTSFDYKEKKWTKKSFPFPDVIYVRGGGDGTADLLEKFDGLGIKRINPIHAFNKSDLYQHLNQDQNVRPHLPPTVNVEKWSDMESSLLKFRHAYVKAHRGRKGLQVMRVERLPNDTGYLYSYSIIGKLVRGKAINMESLLKTIRAFFGDKKVIVQRAIDLVKIKNNRLVDFRAEVQRNKQNDIDIVGICARVGRPNSPITTHSSAYRYDVYLPKLFPRYTAQKLNVLKSNIQDFLHKVYASVEKKYGEFGEIGIDFAVDKKGKIWLIECNAQSAKVSIVKAYGAKAQRVFLNPLEYARTIVNTNRYPLFNPRSRSSRTAEATEAVTAAEAVREARKAVGVRKVRIIDDQHQKFRERIEETGL